MPTMSHQDITDLITKYSACKKCNLKDARDQNNEDIFIGQGALAADLLVVIPRPNFVDPQGPIAYEVDSDEYRMYKGITDKLGFDRQKIYITATVACQPDLGCKIAVSNVVACRPKMNDILNIVNPKAVMLMGPEALFSWTGEDIARSKFGRVESDKERICYWSHDFSRYLEKKTKNQADGEKIANEIFKHWQELKELINE
jgi:uracil-DNA glycosylase family 4